MNFPLPDGNFIQVPSTVSFEEADAWARKNFPDSYATKTPEKQKGGFFSNLGAGIRTTTSDIGLGIGALIDEDTARQARRADAQAEEARIIKSVGLEDVKQA